MVRSLRAVVGVVLVAALVVGPSVYAWQWLGQKRKFRVVQPGVLYRSGQPGVAALKRLVHDHGIRTVITLRDPCDLAEQAYCHAQEIRFVQLTPRSWDDNEANVRRFLDVMADRSNYPVLVHCFAGVHRTGAYCAIYRMEYQGWDNARAMAELEAAGYDNLAGEDDIRGFLQHYRPGERRAQASASPSE